MASSGAEISILANAAATESEAVVGFLGLELDFVLYLYCRQEQIERLPSHFCCVHHFTVLGEPISFLLVPRD